MDITFLTFCYFQKTKNVVANNLSIYLILHMWVYLGRQAPRRGITESEGCAFVMSTYKCNTVSPHMKTQLSNFWFLPIHRWKILSFFCILTMNEADCFSYAKEPTHLTHSGKLHRILPCSSLVFWQVIPDLINFIHFIYSTNPHWVLLDTRETGEKPVPHHEELTVWQEDSQCTLYAVLLWDRPAPRWRVPGGCRVAEQTGGEAGKAPREGDASAESEQYEAEWARRAKVR